MIIIEQLIGVFLNISDELSEFSFGMDDLYVQVYSRVDNDGIVCLLIGFGHYNNYNNTLVHE